MDEGTLKTPIPKCRLYWSFLFGVGGNFVGSEAGQKQSVTLLQNVVYITNLTTPPQPQTVCTVQYITMGGGEVREKIEGQQYTSIVPSFMVVTVHKLGRKYQQ